MNIAYISSYVPRKCGIATYTKDLVKEALSLGHQISVFALENPITPNVYSDPVTQTIGQYTVDDYIQAANTINNSSIELVHLQHEFGLFGGEDGENILLLAQALNKPLIVTFHTVLRTPSPLQKSIIQELSRIAHKVIVMDKMGKDRLETVYGLNSSDISIILHGAPIVTQTNSHEAKITIGYPSSFILLANNLLSRNKGIEYGIDAVGKLKDYIPNLLFLIVGETHPLVKIEEGESYREELIAQVKRLGLEKNVIFKNEYVSQEELKTILSAADVYITPYLDPQQISSGTLSYAIGAGKACIATEYVYAKEMLSSDRGMLVPFRDSTSIAESLKVLYDDPNKKHLFETRVRKFSKEMGWPKVFHKHFELYNKIKKEKENLTQRSIDFIQNPINSSHLENMTNKNGVVQHSINVFPSLQFGYSTCDNARALIVASQLFNTHKSDEYLRLIKIYSKFLISASDDSGKFHTFLDKELNWSDQVGITDAYGRAIWGLGFHLYKIPSSSLEKPVRALIEKSMSQMENVIDLRNAAYCVLGLYYFILAYKSDKKTTLIAIKHIARLGDFIMAAFLKNSRGNWKWFEETITYDNFRIPQALFAVYLTTGNEKLLDIAKSSLKFITECNFDDEKKYFDFVGQDGWMSRGKDKAKYDQQPLEAAGAIDANIFAAITLQDTAYLRQADLAFEWFFGNNRNHRTIYDSNSKGVYDGLTSRGVNVNQGAESIICFLSSSLFLQETKQDLISFQKKFVFTNNKDVCLPLAKIKSVQG